MPERPETGEGMAFEVVAPRVLGKLVESMRGLIGATPGEITTAAELERGLGVSKKVAWQVFRIAESKEPLSAAGFVPGADPVRKLLEAAEKCRVPAKVRAEVWEAFQAFESLVASQAGDRASFISMLGISEGEESVDVERLHQRACFKAYAHFLGAQIATRYGAVMVRKDHWDNTDTFVSLRARLGLRRLRQDATVVVDRYFVTTGVGDRKAVSPAPRPLDVGAWEKYKAAVLPAFCTKPLPALRTLSEGDGSSRVELAERKVGLGGAVDLVFGTVTSGVPAAVPQPGSPHGFHAMAKIDFPSELLVMDVFVHAGDYGKLNPELYIYADPGSEETKERRELSPQLRTRDKIVHVGRGLGSDAIRGIPRRTEMIAHLCGGMGWDPEEFEVYRLKIEYPLMHTVIRMAFPTEEA